MTAEPSTELRPPSGEAFDPSLVEGMIRVIARMEVVNPESRAPTGLMNKLQGLGWHFFC